jgi:hypothetical protein
MSQIRLLEFTDERVNFPSDVKRQIADRVLALWQKDMGADHSSDYVWQVCDDAFAQLENTSRDPN